MMIPHTQSLLILLSAFQRSYSMFSGKDTGSRLRLSQSKQLRSAATATAQPAHLANQGEDSESPSKYPSARTYRNMRLHETFPNSKPACFSMKP